MYVREREGGVEVRGCVCKFSWNSPTPTEKSLSLLLYSRCSFRDYPDDSAGATIFTFLSMKHPQSIESKEKPIREATNPILE